MGKYESIGVRLPPPHNRMDLFTRSISFDDAGRKYFTVEQWVLSSGSPNHVVKLTRTCGPDKQVWFSDEWNQSDVCHPLETEPKWKPHNTVHRKRDINVRRRPKKRDHRRPTKSKKTP